MAIAAGASAGLVGLSDGCDCGVCFGMRNKETGTIQSSMFILLVIFFAMHACGIKEKDKDG